MGGEEKKIPPKNNQLGLRKRKRKGQPEFINLVSLGTRRDKKGTPIIAPITKRRVYKKDL
jgi:hypothetical protein